MIDTYTMLLDGEAENGFVSLATMDESEPYEVDCSGIVLRPDGKFLLRTASGCSCWDGDHDEEEFDSIEDLAASLVTRDRTWNPSIEGGKKLVGAAIAALAKRQGDPK